MSTQVSTERIGLSMQQCESMAVDLSNMVEANCATTSHQYDTLFVLPRGGFMPANVVSRRLGFGALDIVSGSMTSYLLGNTNSQSLECGQMPPQNLIEGKHILAIDEVSDTDETLEGVREFAYKLGALSVKTGVLVYKPGRNTSGVVPDFFVMKHNGWVDFYWEAHDEVGKTSIAKRREEAKIA